MFEREAGSHHGGELDVVHDVGAGVGRHFFFQDLFACPAYAGNQASQSRDVHDRFHKLVVRHGYILKLIFQMSRKRSWHSSHMTSFYSQNLHIPLFHENSSLVKLFEHSSQR